MTEIERKFSVSFKQIISTNDTGQQSQIYVTDNGALGDVIYLKGDFTLNQLNQIKCVFDYFCKHPELNVLAVKIYDEPNKE